MGPQCIHSPLAFAGLGWAAVLTWRCCTPALVLWLWGRAWSYGSAALWTCLETTHLFKTFSIFILNPELVWVHLVRDSDIFFPVFICLFGWLSMCFISLAPLAFLWSLIRANMQTTFPSGKFLLQTQGSGSGAANPACLGEWAWGGCCCHCRAMHVPGPAVPIPIMCRLPRWAKPLSAPHKSSQQHHLGHWVVWEWQQLCWHPGGCRIGTQGRAGSLAQSWHRLCCSAWAAEEQLAVAASLQKMSKHFSRGCLSLSQVPLCSERRPHAPTPCTPGCHGEGECAKSQEIFHQAWEAAAHIVHRHILALLLPAASWSSQILRQRRTCRNKRYFSLSQVPLETVQAAASSCSPISTCN